MCSATSQRVFFLDHLPFQWQETKHSAWQDVNLPRAQFPMLMLSFAVGRRDRRIKTVETRAVWWKLWRGHTRDAEEELCHQEGVRAQEAGNV